MSWRRSSKVNYGNKLVNDLYDTRRRELEGNEDVHDPVVLTARQRRDLARLVTLRREVKNLEAGFAAHGLDVSSPNTPGHLDALQRSYEYRRRHDERRAARLKPKLLQLSKLRQETSVKLLKATTRQEQGAIIEGYMQALAEVK